MTAVLALAGAVVGSYLLRITFVTLIDVERLPAVIRVALAYVGPAVIAAIVVTSLAHGDGHGGLRLSMAQLCGWSPPRSQHG